MGPNSRADHEILVGMALFSRSDDRKESVFVLQVEQLLKPPNALVHLLFHFSSELKAFTDFDNCCVHWEQFDWRQPLFRPAFIDYRQIRFGFLNGTD